jgi:hypothetical protein
MMTTQIRQLPPEKRIPRGQMTLREQQDAQLADQAALSLEVQIRRLGRERDLDEEEIARLVDEARAAFRFVNGQPVPVAEDRQTVLLAADGESVMTVEE